MKKKKKFEYKKSDEYEHREKMGVKKGEKVVVHHKDGNKKNNKKNNLEVMSYSKHNSLKGHGAKKFTKKQAEKREKDRKLDWWHRVGKYLDKRNSNLTKKK